MEDVNPVKEEVELVLIRINGFATEKKVLFATELNGEERKKNRDTAARFNLSKEDRIRIVCGLRPEEFYEVVPERVKSLEKYEDRMYVFMANRRLQNVQDNKIEDVCLYVKFQFKKPAEDGALIVSFHEAERDVDDSRRKK